MRGFKSSSWLLFCVIFFFVIPEHSYALGFKSPKVLSFLNQPLKFHVEITDQNPNITLEMYKLVSAIDKSEFGTQNEIDVLGEITIKSNERKVALVRTKQIITEPFIRLNLELERGGLKISRIFTILLEPPTFLSTDSGENYLVKVTTDDTVWSIAEKFMQKDSFTIEQMMMAIYRLNPDSFYKNNINMLKNNSEIIIPAIETIVSLNQKEAEKIFQEQYQEWKNQYSNLIKKRDIETQFKDQPQLEVLSSSDTKKIETTKNELLSSGGSNAFQDNKNNLQMKINGAQNEMILLEKRLEEQSKEIANLKVEIKALKLNDIGKLEPSSLTAFEAGSEGFDLWFYLILLSFFTLAGAIGFALAKKSKERIRQMDTGFLNQNDVINTNPRAEISKDIKKTNSLTFKENEQTNLSDPIILTKSKPSEQLILSINSYLAYERYETALRECKIGLKEFPYSVELSILLLKILKESGESVGFEEENSKIRSVFGEGSDEWSLISRSINPLKTQLTQNLSSDIDTNLNTISPAEEVDLDLDLDLESNVDNQDDETSKKG